MNVKRGMDRTAFVLALVAIIPGGFWGWNIYDQEKTKKVRAESKKEIISYQDFTELEGQATPKPSAEEFLRSDEYHHPANWQCAIAGVTGAGVAFLFILFSVSGTTRLVLWIIDGFKGQKKPS